MTHNFSKEEKQQLSERFENGETLRELSIDFGWSISTIRTLLIKILGLKNYEKSAKKHFQNSWIKWNIAHPEEHAKNARKMGQAPKTKNQIAASQRNGAKARIKWNIEHPEEHAKNVKKAQEAAIKANPSKPEILFSVILANENIQFTHQFRIKNWWVDFFIFPNVIVQIDGVYWHCRYEKGRLLSDWLQNQELKKQGFKVIRFWDFEINNDIEKCLKKLKRFTYTFC